MKKPHLIITIIGLSILQFSSCKNNSKEALLGGLGCDTTNTKFAAVIQPIITTQCNTQSGCHGGSSLGSISLESYQNVKDNYASILTRIKKNPGESGFMPKSNPKMDDCSILKIETWVNKGAQNN